MSYRVGNHTVVVWNLRKNEWDLHPKMWETEAGRQRISKALKVISVAGGVAAGLMASGVVGSFSAVVVTATGLAALVAYVAGRHFGLSRELWKDPEFLAKKGKAALDRLGTGPNCIKNFRNSNQYLFLNNILKDDDIKALMKKKYYQKDKWTPGEFAQVYGIEGLKLLPVDVHESLKTNFFEVLINNLSLESWPMWYREISSSTDVICMNIIEIVKLFGYDQESLLSELCRLDMEKCKNGVAGYPYPFISKRNTPSKMVEVNRELSKKLFEKHVSSSSLTFSEMQRDFSDELKTFYPNKGDIEAFAADDLKKLDVSKPETYAAFKERWGLKGLKMMSEQTLKGKVAPVAKAYFATQGCKGLSEYLRNFWVEMTVLGISIDEIAPDILKAEIELLKNKKIGWRKFIGRNTYGQSNKTHSPFGHMSDEQKLEIIPNFIRSVYLSKDRKFKKHEHESKELGLTSETFRIKLVEKALEKEKKIRLDKLVTDFELNADVINDGNKESIKKAFYRMPATEWAKDAYAAYRDKLGIENEEMLAAFKKQYNSKSDTTILPDWKEKGIVTDKQLSAVVEEVLLNNQNAQYSNFARAAYKVLENEAQEQLRTQEIDNIVDKSEGFLAARRTIKLSDEQDLAAKIIPKEVERAKGDFGTFYERNGSYGWEHVQNKGVFKDSFETWIDKLSMSPYRFENEFLRVANSLQLEGNKILVQLCEADVKKCQEGSLDYMQLMERCDEVITSDQKETLREAFIRYIKEKKIPYSSLISDDRYAYHDERLNSMIRSELTSGLSQFKLTETEKEELFVDPLLEKKDVQGFSSFVRAPGAKEIVSALSKDKQAKLLKLYPNQARQLGPDVVRQMPNGSKIWSDAQAKPFNDHIREELKSEDRSYFFVWIPELRNGQEYTMNSESVELLSQFDKISLPEYLYKQLQLKEKSHKVVAVAYVGGTGSDTEWKMSSPLNRNYEFIYSESEKTSHHRITEYSRPYNFETYNLKVKKVKR